MDWFYSNRWILFHVLFFDKMASLSQSKKTRANESRPFTHNSNPNFTKIAIKPKQTQLIIQKCHFHCKYHCWFFARDTSYSVHCSESNFHIWQLSPGESCHWVPWSSSGKRHTSVILYTLKLTKEETQNLDILSFWIGFKTKQNHFGVGKPDSHGIVVWLQAISEIPEYSRSENRTWIY